MSLANLMSKRRRDERGFTLVELLVVIVILAVLAAIVLPKFADSSKRSKEAALRTDLKLLRNAISTFKADTGNNPQSLADLAETDPTSVKVANGGSGAAVVIGDWHGPYLQSVPTDPVADGVFIYTPADGNVRSNASGDGLDHTAYSTW